MASTTSPVLNPSGGSVTAATGRRSTFGDWHIQRETIDLALVPAGADPSALEAASDFIIPASATPTMVRVKTAVSAEAVQHARSAAAVGVQRRRRVANIVKLLRGLPAHVASEDFHTRAYPLFEEVRRLQQDLLSFEQYEGNTCMILRYVRNSLMDRGWRAYRDPNTVHAVAAILDRLAGVEVVTRDDARQAFRTFYELGLRAALPVTIEADDNDGGEDDGGDGGAEDGQ